MDASVPRGENGSENERVENEALVRLGDLLRRARENRGITMVDLCGRVSISQSRLSLLERGMYPRVDKADLNRISEALEIDRATADELHRLLELSKLPHSSMANIGLKGLDRQQHDIAREERKSRRIAHFSSVLVPGLLQLPGYSRALFAQLGVSQARAEEAMQARQLRQQVLAEARKTFRFVLHESVLYTVIGDRRGHIDQLNWLAMMSARPNIEVRVLLTSSGNDLDALHGFTVHDRRLVTVESMLEYQSSERPEDVDHFLAVFDRLMTRAQADIASVLQVITEAVRAGPSA